MEGPAPGRDDVWLSLLFTSLTDASSGSRLKLKGTANLFIQQRTSTRQTDYRSKVVVVVVVGWGRLWVGWKKKPQLPNNYSRIQQSTV